MLGKRLGVGMASVGRNVRVLPVRVLGKCGGFDSDVIAGMRWAAGLAVPAGDVANCASVRNDYDLGLRDAALISLAYDAGLRFSELVAATVADLRQVGDGSGRLEIVHSKTDQLGEGALAWLSPDTWVGCVRYASP